MNLFNPHLILIRQLNPSHISRKACISSRPMAHTNRLIPMQSPIAIVIGAKIVPKNTARSENFLLVPRK